MRLRESKSSFALSVVLMLGMAKKKFVKKQINALS
jgi:hypothetical protein